MASQRWNVMRVITRRELRSTLFGIGIYVAAAIILLVISLTQLRPVLQLVDQAGVLAAPNFVEPAFMLFALFGSVYLGLCAAISIARERDLGTLEVLFYGPVDAPSYVLGKFLQQMLAFIVMMIFGSLSLYLMATLTQIGFPVNFATLVPLGLALGAYLVSLGMLLSALNRRMVVALVIYVVACGALYAFHAAYDRITQMSGAELTASQTYTYLLIFLESLYGVVRWISPLAFFERASLAAAMGETGQYALNLLGQGVYAAALLALAIAAFNWKGVRR